MENNPVLITGGAGYIGSHAVLAFLEAGHDVIVLDDLSTGRRELLPPDVPFVVGHVGDTKLVSELLREHRIGAVIHFAGSIIVPESVADPLKYYRNNTCASCNLIQCCIDAGVRRFVFSSTAAVYGEASSAPLCEGAPTVPINPYGNSKLMTEGILRDTAAAHDFTYAALRYFNVAGADPLGRTGQSTPEATHLIKVASQAAVGARAYLEIYGEDYETPDGTCVRDYIHVTDLVAAHVKALDHLRKDNESVVLNCGYGRGYSVREVLGAVNDQTGGRLDIRSAPRRAGDPASLVADARKAREILGWEPQYDSLDVIVRNAIDWERRLSGGRPTVSS
jgi:UDP-glucose 4-epimerase